jgi:hypothetical protein
MNPRHKPDRSFIVVGCTRYGSDVLCFLAADIKDAQRQFCEHCSDGKRSKPTDPDNFEDPQRIIIDGVFDCGSHEPKWVDT